MNRPIFVTSIAALCASAAPVFAQSGDSAYNAAADTETQPPTLIVALAVDQLSSDLFVQYRPHFEHGLKRLSDGAVFPSGFQSHAATETCPGHSTILTGTYPARNGIVANRWFELDNARADKRIYCSEDTSVPGSSSTNYTASPVHLLMPTLGERMKAANLAAKNVAVSGKDRGALMMGGTQTDRVYWWGGSGFATLAGRQLSAPAVAVNATIADMLAAPRGGIEAPGHCAARAAGVRVSETQTVGTYDFARPANQPAIFRTSPDLDAVTLDLATALVDSEGLGEDDVADVLSISLSATDYVGHAFGTEGLEMCIQIAQLDRHLGDFFDGLDERGIDYIVALTSDHGGHDLPERLRAQALPTADRVDPALVPAAMNAAVAAKLGLDANLPVIRGDAPFGDMYIARELTDEQRAAVLAEITTILEAHPQVEAMLTAEVLSAMPIPTGPVQQWTSAERARVSFYPGRSGDYLVLLEHGITPIPAPGVGYVATHGSPWDYDRRVPILFWRKGMTGFEQPNPVQVVDIAPTLASVIGLTIADKIDGRCLDLDAGAGTTCR